MSRRIDLIGQKFGRLIVIQRVNNDKWGNSRWLCKCDCENETIVLGSNLQSNHTQSCGCLWEEIISACHIKHGHRKALMTSVRKYKKYQKRENHE